MLKKKFVPLLLASAAVLPMLQGCIPVVAGGAAATGVAAAQERTVGGAVDDTTIWAEIKHHYIQADINELLEDVNVEVNEGRVLLTGSVRDPQTRVDAVKYAWKPNGVKEVINEINVTDKSSLKDLAKDTWITTQIKSKFLLNQDIRSINYYVETINGVVYLLGVAQDQQELDAATNLASTVNGVQRVISYMRMKDQYAPKI